MAFTTLTSPTELSLEDAEQIRATAKWARLVAILGFTLIGLLLLFGAFLSFYLSRLFTLQAAMTGQALPMDPTMMGILYMVILLVLSVVYFFPTLFLFQYASRTLRAFRNGFDAAQFSAGLRAHRSMYGYVTILLAILTALYLIIGVVMGIGFAFLPQMPAGAPM